jgi:hypothetical protein
MSAAIDLHGAAEGEKLPFGPDWQRVLTHLLIEDERFADVIRPYLRNEYLESDIHKWVWATALAHRERYRVFPSWTALEEAARKLDPKMRPMFELGLAQVRHAPTHDAEWVRATAVEWVRRNVFVRAFGASRDLYNVGKLDLAYDTLMAEMDRFAEVALATETINESWLAEDFTKRQAQRFQAQTYGTVTPTGIPRLDAAMNGGLDLGQFGLFMSYSKVGKTTMLVNIGRVAVRTRYRNVAHFFFEGSMDQLGNRYDASFSAEIYTAVRSGNISDERYRDLFQQYQHYKSRLYLRGFVDKWEYTIEDVWHAIDRLRRKFGWQPDVVLLDYADLLKGRGSSYDNEYDSNAAAYRDIKTLSTKGRGYAIWSAAQAKKPTNDTYDIKPHLLKSNDLGGRYEKVKVCDALISMNATYEERAKLGLMRLWVEALRDNPGSFEIEVPCDYDRMVFGAGAGLNRVLPPVAMAQPPPPNATAPQLGYRQLGPSLA